MVRLGVNIDHIATLRQVRRAEDPTRCTRRPVGRAGGRPRDHGSLERRWTARPDRDVEILRKVVKTRLNVEMAATQEMVRVALTVKPDQVTLVPERREEVTTEGRSTWCSTGVQLSRSCGRSPRAGIHVSLFITPIRAGQAVAQDRRARDRDQHGRLAEAGNDHAREEALRKVSTPLASAGSSA